ncbi:septum formation initiator family protein [Ferrimicrobium sp.]|uniref:FtsB family cell division protein n=1 Tax=Ferrimicrobium sp. TaxID=2926050 RepID=UPI0027E40DEE|nr:septum formation initiator family protein [Ferrimicrobium sp.]
MKVRRRVIILAALLLGVVVYATTVLPTSQLLNVIATKHHDTAELHQLQATNTKLEQSVAQLNSPQWIEQIARNEFGMYPTGSTPYQILPSSPLYQTPAPKS